MSAVREGFQKDHATFDMVLWLRLLLLFAGKRSCFQYVKDGSLFELWNHSSGCFLPTWSATFFALLLRALKYAWASGQSLSDDLQPYLPNLFQSVVGEIGLYSATGGLMRISKTKIPSQYGPLLSAFNPKLLDRMAGVFVFLMSPADSEVFEYVRTLFNLCTPFMNPSTSNIVQKQMSVFMDDLVTHYTRRVYRERMSSDIVAVPEASRMPLDSDDWLVELCEAFTFQSVFARDYKVVRRAEMTMKKLVHLRPHTLLLPVVHRCVNVLDNKSQSLHLATMYRVLVIAPQFVPLLIEAALPGLDPSDPTKTMAAIPFFLGLVGQMQLVDATDLTITIEDCDEFLAKVRSVSGCFVRPSPSLEAVHSSSKDTTVFFNTVHDDIFVTPDLSTAEGLLETVHARQAVSCQFPEFGYLLFDRLLTIASHITPVGAGSSRDPRLSESDIQLLSGIRNGIGLVASQVDAAGFRRMARTVLDWVKGKALQPKVASMIVLGLSIGDPAATFTTFSQPLVSVLLKDDKFDPKLEVSGLKKYLSVVSAIVRMAPAEVRYHWPTLKLVIQNAFDASDKGIFKLGMKLLRRCIESQLVTYPRSFSALSKELRHSDEIRKKLLIMTGESWLLEQICIPELREPIEWRFPNKSDMDFGRELASWGFRYAVACIRSCCDEPLPQSIAQLECFFPGERSQVQLSADVVGLSRIKLLTRGINSIRATLRGLSCVYLDERPSEAPSTLCIALDMPSDNAALTDTLGEAILALATLFLGIKLDSDLLAPTSLQTDMGSEEPKLRRKFLRLLGQVLIRPGASFFPRGRAGNQSFRTFVAWFSPLSKVYPHCHWQNLSSYFWIEQLGRFWESRLTSRKNDIPFHGTRRQLILLVAQFSIQKYATVRAFAQEVLTACCSVHFGARSELARMQLGKLNSVVESLKISPEGTTDPETYDDVTHSTIMGMCYNLDSTTSMRRVWRDPALLAETLKTICVFLKHSHQDVRSKASNKLLNLTSTALTSRHLLPRTSRFQEHVLKGVVQWLLNQLNHETNYHWRFEIVSTVILQAFMSPPPFKAEWNSPLPHPQGEDSVDRRRLCVVEDDALVDELILEYLRWLISGLGRGPLQAGLSIVGITYLLSAFSKHPERLSPAVVELLHTSCLESAVVGACPSTFHEVLRATTFPPYPLEIVELTQEMLRPQKEWPYVRLPKSSTVFSLKNVFFGRVYFSVLYATSPHPEETVASHIRILERLSDAPVATEIEAHIACAELTAGFLVFMQELEPELQISIWTGHLQALFLQELERASVERVWDWVDCIRFVFLAKSAKGSKHLVRLVLNTILNPLGSSDSMWEPLVIFKDPSDDQTPYKGTFADLKRFYLLRFALEVLPTENQDASLLKSLAESLLGLQDVETVQGREEVQRGLLTIRAICSRPDCSDELRKVEDIIVRGVHEAAMGVIPDLLVDSSSKESRTPEQSRV
ncbi:MAG: uncharacterized protein KVP18_001585, partial [Porospora cf. gigantea A]|uniref:uncharacterized protein n=1 Tax=Porospora cf. gigantea A TaxID=2853593 RepID=UPI00355A9E94